MAEKNYIRNQENLVKILSNLKEKPWVKKPRIDILSTEKSKAQFETVQGYKGNIDKSTYYSWNKDYINNQATIKSMLGDHNRVDGPFNVYHNSQVYNKRFNRHLAFQQANIASTSIDTERLFVDVETMLHSPTGEWKLSEVTLLKYKPSEIAKLGVTEAQEKLSKAKEVLFVNRDEYGGLLNKMRNSYKSYKHANDALASMDKKDLMTLSRIAGFSGAKEGTLNTFNYTPDERMLKYAFSKETVKLNITPEDAKKFYDEVSSGFDNLKALKADGLTQVGNVKLGSERAVGDYMRGTFDKVGDDLKIAAYNAGYDIQQVAEVAYRDKAEYEKFLSMSKANMIDSYGTSMAMAKQPKYQLKAMGLTGNVPAQVSQENMFGYLFKKKAPMPHFSGTDSIAGAMVESKVATTFKQAKHGSFSAGDILFATGTPNLKSNGADASKLFDQQTMASEFLYRLEGVYEDAKSGKQIVEFSQVIPDVASNQYVKTRSVFGHIGKDEIYDFFTNNFIKAKSGTPEFFEMMDANANKTRNKVLDELTKSLGMYGNTSNIERYNQLKSIAYGNVPEGLAGPMLHYSKSKQFKKKLKEYFNIYGNKFDEVIGSFKGKTNQEIDALLPLAFKGFKADELFDHVSKQGSEAPKGIGRFIEVPEEFTRFRKRRIRLGNDFMASNDISSILSGIRDEMGDAGKKYTMAEIAHKKFFGFNKTTKVAKIGENSIFAKLMTSAGLGDALKDINDSKMLNKVRRSLLQNDTNPGDIIAKLLRSTNLPMSQYKEFEANAKKVEYLNQFIDKAKESNNIAKLDVNNLADMMNFGTKPSNQLPFFAKTLGDLKANKVMYSNQIHDIFDTINLNIKGKGQAVMKLMNNSREIQITLLSQAGHERMKAAALNAIQHMPGDHTGDILSTIKIPLPSYGKMTYGDRELHGRTFDSLPKELAKELNLTDETIAKYSGRSVHASELFMAAYGDKNFVNKLSVNMGKASDLFKQIKGATGESRDKLIKEYNAQINSLRSVVNYPGNKVAEHIASSYGGDNWMRSLGLDVTNNASKGSYADIIKSSEHVFDIDGKYPNEVKKQMQEKVAEIAMDGAGNEGIAYSRDTLMSKGILSTTDASSYHPFGKAYNTQSPRINQALNHEIFELQSGITGNTPFMMTEEAMNLERRLGTDIGKIGTDASIKIGKERMSRHIPAIVGFTNITDEVAKDFGHSGATTIESSAIISESVRNKLTIVRDIEMTVPRTLVGNAYGPLNNKIDHGTIVGTSDANDPIRYIASHEDRVGYAKMIGEPIPTANGSKIRIQERMPLAQANLITPGAKVTPVAIPNDTMKQITNTDIVDMLIGPEELTKKSRLHPGAVIDSRVNLAIAMTRDETGHIASEVGRLTGYSSEDALSQANATMKMLNITDKYDGTNIYKVSDNINNINEISKQLDEIGIFKPFKNKYGGDTWLGAMNVHVSGASDYSRIAGPGGSDTWGGVRMTHRELQNLYQQGSPEIAEALARTIDGRDFEIGKTYYQSLAHLGGEARDTSIPEVNLKDYTPIVKGDEGYKLKGTVLENITKKPVYINLPTEARMNLLEGSSDRVMGKNIKSILVPQLDPRVIGEEAQGRMISRIAQLTQAKKSDGTPWGQVEYDKFASEFGHDIAEATYGKHSQASVSSVARPDKSGILQIMQNVTPGEDTVARINPETLNELLGKNAQAIRDEFQTRGKDILGLGHRYPTSRSESTAAFSLVADADVSRGNLHAPTGLGVGWHSDQDGDKALAMILSGNDNKDIERIFQEGATKEEISKGVSAWVEHPVYKAEEKMIASRTNYNKFARAELFKKYQGLEKFSAYELARALESNPSSYQSLSAGTFTQAKADALKDLVSLKMSTKMDTPMLSIFNDMTRIMSETVRGHAQTDEAKLVIAGLGAIKQSALSSKSTGESPAEELNALFRSHRGMTVNEMEESVVNILKGKNVWDKYIEESAGVLHEVLPDLTPEAKGKAAINETLRTLSIFAEEHAEGKTISQMGSIFKPIFASEKKSITLSAALEAQGQEALYGTYGTIKSVMSGTADDALKISANMVQDYAEKKLAKGGSMGKIMVGAAIVAGITGAAYVGANLLGSSPVAQPRIPQTVTATNTNTNASYERMYVDVQANGRKGVRDLDKYTHSAIQNAMPISLNGNISISDNTPDIHSVVSNAFERMLS